MATILHSTLLITFGIVALATTGTADLVSPANNDIADQPEQTMLEGELLLNRETSIFLFKSETKRFYFHHYKRRHNITLTVTPCESALRIELYHVNSKILKRYRKRRNHRRQRKEYMRLIGQKLLHNTNRHLFVNQTTSKRFEFVESRLRPGLYIIELTSVDGDLSGRVYLSSNGRPYPSIPPVATILSKQIYLNNDYGLNSGERNASVEIWWNPVAIDNGGEEQTTEYEYCLMISANKHYGDNCMLNPKDVSRDLFSDIEKEPEIEELKPKSFWWRRASKRLYQYMINKRFEESVVHFQCYESTKAVVHRLKPKAIYYADVFVRNKWNNLTSAYWTSNFTLTEPESDSAFMAAFSSRQLLHDSLYTGVFLDTKNKFKKRFYFKATPILSNKIYIYVQPCSGLGPVQFLIRQAFTVSDYRRKRHEDNGIDSETIITSTKAEESDESVLYFEEITETKTIELSLPVIETNDTVLLEFELNTVAHRQSRSLILLASSGLNRFPFPRLPVERTVRSMETIRKCDSITLVWNASPDQRVVYCLLQRNADFRNSAFEEPKDLCAKLTPVNPNKRALEDQYQYDERYSIPTRKVICRRYKSSKHRFNKNLIMQEVRKLAPGRRYVFQVEISKGRGSGRRLYYEQVWAETKPEAQCESQSGRSKRKDFWRM